ncbi:MAG: FimB/Mfa2 family fimbrial subunit [Tannerellaceae bacterium]|nr:FimB/Mfa2 family fimbrial subunit [Tannerellaceae bacterium]
MNKKVILQFTALLVLLFSGCLREDTDGCDFGEEGGGELILHFTYTGIWGEDEFPDRIHDVELFVFTEDGFFLESHRYNQEALQEFQGAELTLASGNYYIVYWGNKTSNTILPELTAETTIHRSRLSYNSTQSGDSLYYAPRKQSSSSADLTLYQVTVPNRGIEEQTINFMTAYYTMNVYVKGFERVSDSGSQLPVIAVANLPDGYNFHLSPGEYITTLSQNSSQILYHTESVAYASFLTTHFETESPIEIRVSRSTGERVYTVELQSLLEEYEYQLAMGVHTVIDIYIEITADGSVKVTLSIPGWESTGVNPSY